MSEQCGKAQGCRAKWVVPLVFAVACQGNITPPGAQRWTPPPSNFSQAETDFECDAELARGGIDAPLRRLSQAQVSHTVRDVVVRLLGDGASPVLRGVDAAIGALPRDQRTTDALQQSGQLAFFRADQSVGEDAARGHDGLAAALAAALTTDERLLDMGFECLVSEGANDGACIDRFLDRLGPLTHRRPLDADMRAFYRDEVYGAGDTISRVDLRDLVHVLFGQPYFLFHVEGTGELDSFELANRLSYQLWDSMPDEALYAAAESGALLTADGWDAQIARALEDDRARDAVRSFIVEWFRFDHINVASSGSGPDFAAIAGELNLDASFDAAVEDELVDLFMYTLRSGGTFEDFFLSNITTTTHPELARIYGVSPAAPGGVVTVPPERRSILTRVGTLLARAEVALPTINSITHPILRGVFIRRQIACDRLDPAPGGAMDNLPSVDRSVTGSRAATEILTGDPGCSGCHSRINPAGYALEAFDAIGQHRTEEPLFDAVGTETMRLPIDDEVSIVESRDPVAGGAALADALFETEKAGACFARHYARFSLGRPELPGEADGCLLRELDEAIDAGRPLREVIGLVLLHPEFRVRAAN